VCNLAQIFGKIIPKTTGALPLNTIQGIISIPPPTMVTSIPTYTNYKVKTTMKHTSSLIPSLRVSSSIYNPFVASHIICPTTSPPTIIPLTCPSYAHTPQPYSPPSKNISNDPLLNHLVQTMTSLQKTFPP
jgi:hypothetical protein